MPDGGKYREHVSNHAAIRANRAVYGSQCLNHRAREALGPLATMRRIRDGYVAGEHWVRFGLEPTLNGGLVHLS